MTATSEHTAATVLRAILEAIPASSARRETRLRQALEQAATALESGRDPQAAVRAYYGR